MKSLFLFWQLSQFKNATILLQNPLNGTSKPCCLPRAYSFLLKSVSLLSSVSPCNIWNIETLTNYYSCLDDSNRTGHYPLTHASMASNTCCVEFLVSTFLMTFSITPFSSITKVVRCMPW